MRYDHFSTFSGVETFSVRRQKLLGKKNNDRSKLSIKNSLRSVYESSKSNLELPRYEMPQQSMRADIAYNLIKDELFRISANGGN